MSELSSGSPVGDELPEPSLEQQSKDEMDTEAHDGGSSEAVVQKRKAEDSDGDSSVESPQRNKKRAKLVQSMFDDEAEESGEEGGSEDEGDADAGANDYVPDDFLVLDADETDPTEKKKRQQLSRLRKNKASMLLVEDDIALVHENNAAVIESKSRPIKKIKKTYENEIGPERIRKSELLTSDNEQSEGDDLDDGEDMDDFLVDDLGEGSETEEGVPRVRSKAPRRQTGSSYADGPGQEEIDEAFDIFGEDYGEYYAEDGDAGQEEDSAGESDEDDLFSDRADRRERKRTASLAKKQEARAGGKDGVRSMFERSKLIEKFCTENDDVLRNEDLPERFIGVMTGRIAPDAAERREEAKWMAETLATKIASEYGGVRNFPRHFNYRSEHEVEESLVEPIDSVLSMLQTDRYEVPFIWTYRKDYLHDMMTRKHLWWIHSMDSKWEDLIGRRSHLLSELQLVTSVAEGTLKEESAVELNVQMTSIRQQLAHLYAAKQDAQGVYEVALDATDGEDVSADDRAKVTRAALALEEATRQVERATTEMSSVKAALGEINRKLALRSSYPRDLALDFLHLFPPAKYEAIIQCCTEDVELKDIQSYCGVLLNADKAAKSKKKLKGRRAITEEYRHVRNPNIRKYVETFAPSTATFGYSLRYGRGGLPDTPTPNDDVLSIAGQFTCPEFPTAEEVQQAGRKLLGMEMGWEPSVLRQARLHYRRNAKISTEPTKKGISTINPMHELFGLHTLYMKPISELLEPPTGSSYYIGGSNRTVYARLMKAEREGLLKITITPPDKPDSKLLDNFLPSVPAVRGDDLRRNWDKERMHIIVSTITAALNPAMESETRREMARLAREAIIEETADAYALLVNRGPYRPSSKTFADVVLASPAAVARLTVLSILIPTGGGDKSSTTYMCFIDQEGLVRSQDSIPFAARNKKREKIAQFMKTTKPDVIVINTSGGTQSTSTEAMIMKYLIKEVQEQIRADNETKRNARYDDGYDVPSDDEDDFTFEPEVVLLNDDVAQIYGTSNRARTAFPGIPPGAAAAVSLARMIQNPVAEYANMWRSADSIGTFGFETLFLDLHPLQSLLGQVRAPLLNALECVLVDAVCEAGVDLNAAVQHDHLAGCLAFVGGFGLRKAEALRFNIQRDVGFVASRRQLIERKLMGKIVYNNSAGFLRICDNDNIDAVLDPLDDTRIHPECYVLHDYATKMCASALEEEHNAEMYLATVVKVMKRSKAQINEQLNDKCPIHMDPADFRPRWLGWINEFERFSLAQAACNATVFEADAHPVLRRMAISAPNQIEDILADPITLEDSLDDLVLEEYAPELEASGGGKHFKQLIQIKNELRYPFLDRRPSLPRRPTDSELFTITTGETDKTMYVGLKVVCCVESIKESNAYLSIDNGNLKGSVWIRNVRDEESDAYGSFIPLQSIGDVLKEGTYVEGVVIGVKKEQRRVEVSLKQSDINKGEDWWCHNRATDENMRTWWQQAGRPLHLDPHFNQKEALNLYYNFEQDRIESMEKLMKSKIQPGAEGKMARPIFHPFFRNVSYKQAEDLLKGRGAGEVVFRPSSKGGLSIAWAVKEGIIKHIEVEERGECSVPGGLSSELVIRGEKDSYSDLDEIVGRYISPMNDFVAAMVNYRQFKHLTEQEAEIYFRDQIRINPNQIPYLLRFDQDHPGYFVLSWFFSNSRTSPVKKEYVSVCPEVSDRLH